MLGDISHRLITKEQFINVVQSLLLWAWKWAKFEQKRANALSL